MTFRDTFVTKEEMKKPSAAKVVTTITHRNQVIPIYFTPDTKNGKTYESFTYSYVQNGKRTRRRAKTLADAESAARKVAEQLADGTGQIRTLKSAEVLDFVSAERILHRHPDKTLTEIVAEWETATAALKGIGRISDAVAEFLKASRKATLPEILVSDLLVKFIEAKQREGLSEYYLGDIERKLTRFATCFRVNISTIEPEDISAWLTRNASGRNANNLRTSVGTLFSFARDNGFLPRESTTAAALVKRYKEKPSAIGIYTPEELRRILSGTTERWIPMIAIAALAGIRTSEIFRLDWKDIKLSRGIITIHAANAKTSSRRIVPIVPALLEWLKPCEQTSGEVSPSFTNLNALCRGVAAVCHAAGVAPQRNGFRHSFASYRLATQKSADSVALEMGNSPRKLFTNYREIVTEEDGAAWFDVRPEAS